MLACDFYRRQEVAKVMFLQVSVCPGGVPGLGGVSQHALRQTPPGETATPADSTHPTGMHSCFKFEMTENKNFAITTHTSQRLEFFYSLIIIIYWFIQSGIIFWI